MISLAINGNMYSYDKVFSIAQEVREWAEDRAERSKHNPENLCGWCAIASCELFCRLRDAGIPSQIFMYRGDYAHVFLVVDDHVVDVTASQFHQFRDNAVVILHEKEAEQYEFYERTQDFKSPNHVRSYQKKTGWPVEQTAYREPLIKNWNTILPFKK